MYIALTVIGSLAVIMIAYYGPRYYRWERMQDWPHPVAREPRGCLWIPVAVLVIVITAAAFLLSRP